MNDDFARVLHEIFGASEEVECDVYTPPNYTLHACSKCGIYCADHDSHVCNQKLLEWLKK